MPHAAILVAATSYWTVQRSKQQAVGFAGLAPLLIGRVRNCLPDGIRVSSSECAEESQWSGNRLSGQGRRRSGKVYTHGFILCCSVDNGCCCSRAISTTSAPRARRMALAFACISFSDICPPGPFLAERLQKKTQRRSKRLRAMIKSTVLSRTLLDSPFQEEPRTSSSLFAQIKVVLVAHVKPSICLTARHVDRDQEDPGP